MPESSYWYVATAPLSVPYWTEVTMCEAEFGGQAVLAPMLFTAREKAEEELRQIEKGDADAYLRAVGEYGAEVINRAYDNTPGKQVYEIDRWLFGEHLGDSDYMYVMLDYEVRNAGALADELKALGEDE